MLQTDYLQPKFTALYDYYIDDEEIQEFPVFVGRQKLTSAIKPRPEK